MKRILILAVFMPCAFLGIHVVDAREIVVKANKWGMLPNESVTFTGSVNENGAPLGNTDIGIDDPLLKVCTFGLKTDSNGVFTYTSTVPQAMAPALYTFYFWSGLAKTYMTIVVRQSNTDWMLVPWDTLNLTLGSSNLLDRNTLVFSNKTNNTMLSPASQDQTRDVAMEAINFTGDWLEEDFASFVGDPGNDIVAAAGITCLFPEPVFSKVACVAIGGYLIVSGVHSTVVSLADTSVDHSNLSDKDKADAHEIINAGDCVATILEMDPTNAITSIGSIGSTSWSCGTAIASLSRNTDGQVKRIDIASSSLDASGPTFGISFIKLNGSAQQTAISSGINWLRNHQQQDGSWDGNPAVTSFAVLAMLNWGYTETDQAVSKGIGYIRSKINSDGSVYNYSWYYTYYTSIAILPLVATHNVAYHSDIQKMRNWLIEAQWDENCFYGTGHVDTSNPYYGGFGYDDESRPDLSNTQWALMGLKAADDELGLSAGDSYSKAATYYLPRCQYADGGSGYTYDYGSSIHTMTAASVWSYSLCGVPRNDDRILRGVKWLTDRYSVTNNDGWGAWSEYYYQVTLSKAMTMIGNTKLGSHDWFSDLAGIIESRQNTDGSWTLPDASQIGVAGNTAWAVMALESRTLPTNGTFGMWVTLNSHCDIHIYDKKGRHLGVNYATGVIEDMIPGAVFKILDSNGEEVPYSGNAPDEGMQQVVYLHLWKAGSYRIELLGTSSGPFHLTVNGVQDGNSVISNTYEGQIVTGERLATTVTATAMEGALTLLYGPLTVLPTLEVTPPQIETVVEPNTVKQVTFEVSETGGQETLHSVNIYCTDIVGSGGHITGSQVTFDNSNFDTAPGGEQTVIASIPIPPVFVGPCSGSIVVESLDGGAKSIPIILITNRPPVANAGPDQTVYAWIDGVADVNLDGSGSIDPDGDALSYKWSWTIDGNTYDANGVKPSIELPVGQHVISLIVNDGIVDSEPNEVNITVIGPVKANLCVMPKVLNCKSFLPKIMTTILLPKGITKDQIDTGEPLLLYPGEIKAERMWISRDFDYKCRAWRTTILAWFDKDDLMSAIDGNGKVELAVVGQLKTGQYFFGTDDVNVICPGRWPWHRHWFDHRWNRWCRRPGNFRH